MARGTFSTSNMLLSDETLGVPFTDYPFTLSMWFYANSNSGYLVLWGANQKSVDSNRNILGVKNTEIFHYVNNLEMVHSGMTVSTGQWYHLGFIAASADSRTAVLNTSTNEITTNRTWPPSVDRWSIGITADNSPSSPFDGYIAHAAAWNVALTTSELSAIYTHRLSPLKVRPQNLTIYTPLNDGNGNAQDWVGGYYLIESGTVALTADPPRNHRKQAFLYPASTSVAYSMDAGSGAFAFTGTSATTNQGYGITASSGTFTFTGSTVDVSAGYGTTAGGGTFLFTGTAADPLQGYATGVDSGSFSFSGTTVTLLVGYLTSVDSGAFLFTGSTVDLSESATLTLDVLSGAFGFSGDTATPSAGYGSDVAAGSFALSGDAVGVARSLLVSVDVGSFVFSGTAATLAEEEIRDPTKRFCDSVIILLNSSESVTMLTSASEEAVMTLDAAETIIWTEC